MSDSIVLGIRISRSDYDTVRGLAAKMAAKLNRPVTASTMFRACVEVGMPILEREAHGLVVPSSAKMSESERLGAVAMQLVQRGYRDMMAEMTDDLLPT